MNDPDLCRFSSAVYLKIYTRDDTCTGCGKFECFVLCLSVHFHLSTCNLIWHIKYLKLPKNLSRGKQKLISRLYKRSENRCERLELSQLFQLRYGAF